MIVLFFAGMGVILAGLLAIGFGIPVKEFGFGNTLILTGTVGVCTGLIMLSLAAVIRELKTLAQGLVPADRAVGLRSKREAPVRGAAGGPEADTEERSSEEGPLFSRDQSAVERAATGDAAAPPWQQEVLRERSRGSSPPVETPAEPAEPKRRNLLFSSSRRERERAASERASETSDRDQTTLAPETTAADTSRPTFEDSWPQIDRTRPDSPRRTTSRSPSTFRDAEAVPPPESPAPPRHDAAAEVTVLKSGVVDGMAYSLYSDGSIEAQMPEGMMRFASIDELREHLDQRA
ncbi:DUF308 domain-containing protein [Rhodopseudomonas sp. P2A-2r]|uniref:DUF308 domain-containing protein n=1 Tax=unclassified Rhodopseudomonas TaxID=2638247 RepID=UPI0022347B68|nr:DUF308 domain-containing protein [Rhodopseudomonas sp. P2A-2r]UZE47652.1 DUF308 domain-containing protein [Rhodopseudomonas sp. P2A-2r]